MYIKRDGQKLIIDAPAKINLSLDVINKREDGYHNIKTIFQELDLKDYIYLKEKEGGECLISTSTKHLSCNEENILYKAWFLMKDLYEGDSGVEVHLEKNIPIASGLAGGSSNAASMISGLSELWGLDLSREEMMEIGSQIGADVPFFFLGGTAFGQGIGDELEEVPSLKGKRVLLINNGIGVSTKYVYNHVLIEDRRIDFDSLIKAIEDRDFDKLYQGMENKLEKVTVNLQPEIQNIKYALTEAGANVSLMCGSGPTVFGIFENEEDLDRSFFHLKDRFEIVLPCWTV